MKKERIFAVCLTSVICLFTQAQTSQLEYQPFAQEGKVWETQVGLIQENVYGNKVGEDTIINNETWKKIYNYVGYPEYNNIYYAAVRDVGKKVYAIAKGSKKPRLIYDFYLQEGDMVKCGVEGNAFGCLLDRDEQPDTLLGYPFVSYLKVERIDTIVARNMKHRRYTLSLLDAYKEHYLAGENTIIDSVIWIEGVGSGAGPFSPWMSLPPRQSILQGCWIGKTCLFAFPDFYDAEASTTVSDLMNNSKECFFSDFDLQGRPVQGSPKHGVYIQSGKKVMR